MSAPATAPDLTLSYVTDYLPPATTLVLDGQTRAQHTFAGSGGDNFPGLPLTLGLWIGTSDSTDATIIEYAASGTGGTTLSLSKASALTVSIGGTDWATGVSVATGRWRHICVVLTPGRWGMVDALLQVDSVTVAVKPAAFSIAAGALGPAGTLTLGGTSAAAQLTAKVSELQLWAVAFDAGERLTWLQRRAAAGTTGLSLGWALSDTATSGTLSGVGASSFAPSALRFRTHRPADTAMAMARWTTVSGSTGYDVEVLSSATGWVSRASGVSAIELALDALPMGSPASGRVRAVNADGAGPWSAIATLTPLDLEAPAATLGWQSSDTELWADWSVPGQSDSYTYRLVRTPAASPPADPVTQTGTSANISTCLADPNGWQVFVTAAVAGSRGPESPAGPVTAPDVSLYYVDQSGNGQFEFDWPPNETDPPSARFSVQTGATSLAGAVVHSPTSPQSFDSNAPVSSGETVTGNARFVRLAALSATTERTITINDIPEPAPCFDIAPTIATEAVSWTWGSVTQTPEFDVTLFQDGQPVEQSLKTTAQSLALTGYLPSEAADLARLTIRVQGVDGGTVGPPNAVTDGETTTGALVYRWPGGTSPGTAAFEWTPGTATGQQVYGRVFKTGEVTTYFHGSADLTKKVLTVSAPDTGFAEGDTYTATLSVLAAGSFTGMFASSLTIHKLVAPSVTLRADSTNTTLTASWNPPAGAPAQTSYVVLLNSAAQAAKADTTCDLTSHLADSDALSVQVEATLDKSYSAPSTYSDAPSPAPSLIYQAATGGGGTLTGSWSPAEITYYELTAGQTTTAVLADDGRAQLTVSNPAVGTDYTLKVKSIATCQLGAMAEAPTVTIVDLAAPSVSFAEATGADLAVSWAAIDPGTGSAVTYQVRLDGTNDGAPVSATTTTLTGVLDRNPGQAERIDVQAITTGSHGLWSAVATVDAPSSLGLLYDPETGQATLSWPAATGASAFALAATPGSGAAVRGWTNVPGTSPPATYSESIQIGSVPANTVIAASVRALGGGMIAAETTASVTMRDFPAPGFTASNVQDDPGNHQLDVSWVFDPAAWGLTSANTTFDVEVDDGGTKVGSKTGVQGNSTTVPYPAGTTPGTVLTVKVRAIGDGVIGAWTAPVSISVGSGLGQPTITYFAFDAQNTMTLSWTAVAPPVAGQEVTYEIALTGPGISASYKTRTTSTSANIAAGTTHVEQHQTYTATVTAVEPAPAGPASAPRTASTNQLQPSPPGGGNGDHGGDPFDLATGAYLYSHADLAVTGVVPLRLVVAYNSMLGWPDDHPMFAGQPLGPRWTHSFNARIYIPPTQPAEPYLSLLPGSPSVISYDFPTAVGVVTQRDRPTGDLLVYNSDGSFTLDKLDGSRQFFSAQGRLTRIEDHFGNAQVLTYTPAGRLDRVTDQGSGRYLQFVYVDSNDPESLLASVSDNTGRTVNYAYSGGLLSASTGPQAGPRRFTYTGDALMATAGDENQHTIVSNTYDPTSHRIVRQRTPNGSAQGQPWDYVITWSSGTDAEGHETVIAAMTDPKEQQTTTTSLAVTFDTVEQVIPLSDSIVARKTRVFDGAGRLLSETALEGAGSAPPSDGPAVTYAYDDRGRVTLIDPPGLGSVSRSYDTSGNLLTEADILGNITRYSYNADNTLDSVTEADGTRTQFTYKPGAIRGLAIYIDSYPGDGAGGTTNAPNRVSQTFTSKGQLQSRTDATGNTESFEYASGTGWLTKRTVANADGTTALIEVFDNDAAMGLVTTLSQQYEGQAASQAFVTGFVYDPVGNLTQRTGAAGSVWDFTYDAANNRLTETLPEIDGRRDVRTYDYDEINQLTGIVEQASGPRVAYGFAYDPLGRLSATTDPNSHTIDIDYAQIGKGNTALVRETMTYPAPASGGKTISVFVDRDALGLEHALSLPTEDGATPVVLTQAFAAEPGLADRTTGLRRTLTAPPPSAGGATTTQSWVTDAGGGLYAYTDQKGKVWNWRRGTQASSVGSYVNLTRTLTDPTGRRRVNVVDPNGMRVAVEIGPDGSTHTHGFAFDALGRIRQVVEPIPADPPAGGGTPGPATTLFSYGFDAAQSQTTLDVMPYGTAASRYFYDGEDRLVGYTAPLGVSGRYTYGRGDLMTSWTNGRNQTVNYGFDSAGRLVSAQYPGGDTITHTLDATGNRLETLRNGAAEIHRTFDDLNRMTARTAGGQTVGYSFTPSGQVHVLTYPDGSKTVTYGYDGLDRLSTVTDWAGRETLYTYDPTGRVQVETLPGGVTVTNTYDDAGRRLSMAAGSPDDVLVARTAYTYDDFAQLQTFDQITPVPPSAPTTSPDFTYSADRLTQIGADHVTYDDDGNMLGWAAVGESGIGYDALNRVAALGDLSFTYDADGLRVDIAGGAAGDQAVVHDIADYCAPRVEQADPQRAIRLVSQTNSLPSMLIPEGGRGLADPAPEESPLDRVLALTSGGKTSNFVYGRGLIGREDGDGHCEDYIFDPLGNTLALTDASGAVTGARVYDPYGTPLGASGTSPAPFGTVGRWGVSEDLSGWTYMRAREYAGSAYRFTTRDVIYGDPRLPQTINRYAYLSGQALRMIDPTGLGNDHDGGGGGGGGWGLFGAIVGGVVVGGLIGGAIIAGGGMIGGGGAAGGGGLAAAGGAGAGAAGTGATGTAAGGTAATEAATSTRWVVRAQRGLQTLRQRISTPVRNGYVRVPSSGDIEMDVLAADHPHSL